ncbi:putative caspase [Stachybotrys elegans]|uniref:Caspase n=1 Tax=Stachybotrys elegans TaxID=80388 RepID=A0A8K0WJL4_9HYPO|nr:putative caspase [Stachybotrys elegans]
MDARSGATKHHAILIGIDAYPDKPLNGSASDVQHMQAYLESTNRAVQIQTFTATKTTGSGHALAEEPKDWPTYDNIATAFEKVQAEANPGDFVYIHYSGHGTREPPTQEFSNQASGDLVLVLLGGENGDDTEYLYAVVLGYFLKDMVDKGLIVTLVLDCCFSGSVYRETDVRFIEYQHDVAAKRPKNPALRWDAIATHTTRSASMLPSWLVNPDGYAIYAACGPHEVAKELKDGRGNKFGALSYFLRTTLQEYGGVASKHQHLYSLICAKFRAASTRQSPILYGNKHHGFFDHHVANLASNPVSVFVQEGVPRIPLGQAHMVCLGDTFSLRRSTSPDSAANLTDFVATVQQVGPLTSTISYKTEAVQMENNLVAKPLAQSILQRLPVKLDNTIGHHEKWMLDLKERSLGVHTESSDSPCYLHILLNPKKEYEIRDADGNKVANLNLMREDEVDITYVCDVLEHLTRYNMVKRLANPTPTYLGQEYFTVRMFNRNASYEPGATINLPDKAIVELRVENKSSEPLYVYAFNLGSHWQVENILKGSHEVIPWQDTQRMFSGKLSRKLRISVPDDMKEVGCCEDVVKVILTTHPTTFDVLELPKLHKPAKPGASPSRVSRNVPEDFVVFDFFLRTALI